MCTRLVLAFLFLLCASASAQERVLKDADMPVRKDRLLATDGVARKPIPARKPLPAPKLLGTSLQEVFDTADIETRRVILTMVPRLANSEQRRALLLSGLQHAGDRSGEFIAAISFMTALQLGNEGRSILREAQSRMLIRDERTRLTVEAVLRERS